MSRPPSTFGAGRDLGLLLEGGSVVGLADRPLLDRVISGPSPIAEAAFEALIRRHGPMVARVCGGILGDPHLAEDATQAVFLVLARRASSIRNPDRLAPWLHGVALRTAREARRRQPLERTHTTTEGADMIAPGFDPTQTLIRREQAELLHRAISRLPARYLAPVVLCDLEGLTHAEAAAQLQCPVSTVSIRLKRAKERLRANLARHHLDFESALPPFTLAASIPRTLRATTKAQILANRVLWTTTAAKWKAVMIAALVAGVAAIGAQGGNQDSPPAKPILPKAEAEKPQTPPGAKPVVPPQKEEAAKVEVGFPTVRDVVDSEDFIGHLAASRTVEIRSQTSAVVIDAKVAEGDVVQEGQRLFGVGDQSSLQRIQDLKNEAKKALLRADKIKQDSLSQGDPAERRARDQYIAARKRLAEIEEGTGIVAPFGGIVDRLLVQPGATVEGGKTSLASIIAVDPILIDFEIDERSFLKIRKWLRTQPGLTHLPVHVGLIDETGFPHPGRVLFQTARFSPEKGTCTLHAELPNADRALIPGMTARVRIDYGNPRPVVLIPVTALLSGFRPIDQTGEDALSDNNNIIAVVDDEGSVRSKWIKTVPDVDEFFKVIRGIDPKTKIVLRGAETLRRGESFAKPGEVPPK